MYRKIIAVFMAVMVVATTCVVPSFATDYQSKYNFWNWAYDHSWFLGKLITGSADNVCSVSEDTLHHSTNHQKGEVIDGEQQYTCICDDCGQTFNAVATDLENSYNEFTPSYTIDNDGNITSPGTWRIVPSKSGFDYRLSLVSETVGSLYVQGSNYYNPSLTLRYDFEIPTNTDFYISGEFDWINDSGETKSLRKQTWLLFVNADGNEGSAVSFLTLDDSGENPVYSGNSGKYTRFAIDSSLITTKTLATPFTTEVHLPLVRYYSSGVGLDDAPISGGGNLTYTDDNSNNQFIENQFFDQSTSTYYNPVTDESYHVEDWQYDYSTRTYTGYTENGEVKIHYGDEHITVTEGGNTYNYYYASPSSDGGGSGSGEDSSGDDDGEGLFDKIGELLGTLLGGLIDLVTGVLSGILDSLISLVEMTIEKLGSVVNLFGSFGDALRALWSWLPEDIITILSAGVSVVIFAAVLKLFI